MSCSEIRPSDSALQRMRRAIQAQGVIGELAVRIGTRRGWRRHRCPARQQRRWERNVWELLDELRRAHWSLYDQLDALDVLGFDPLATGGWGRAA